jgi:hypothetical protein
MFGRAAPRPGGLRNVARRPPNTMLSSKTTLFITALLGLSFYLGLQWQGLNESMSNESMSIATGEPNDGYASDMPAVDGEQVLNKWTGKPVVVGWLRVTNVTWSGHVLEIAGYPFKASHQHEKNLHAVVTRCFTVGGSAEWVTATCISDPTMAESCSGWHRGTIQQTIEAAAGTKFTGICGASAFGESRALDMEIFRDMVGVGRLTWARSVRSKFSLRYVPG